MISSGFARLDENPKKRKITVTIMMMMMMMKKKKRGGSEVQGGRVLIPGA